MIRRSAVENAPRQFNQQEVFDYDMLQTDLTNQCPHTHLPHVPGAIIVVVLLLITNPRMKHHAGHYCCNYEYQRTQSY